MRPKKLFSEFRPDDGQAYIDHIKTTNPRLWKKLKTQFNTGRQIVSIQLANGLDWSNEETLRIYLSEFATRFLKLGPNSFPISFNVLEPFFTFNQHNSILQLLDEEESYGISLIDFLDFVTDSNFELDNIDFYENIPEKLIYHFSFTTGFDEFNFSNEQGKTFLISGLSLARQGNEVSMMLQAGESYDKKQAEEYFKTQTREKLNQSVNPIKKSLGLKIEGKGEPKVVPFEGRDDLWLHSIGLLFDLENKTIDIRHVARDENISYKIITDDINSMLVNGDYYSKDHVAEYIENHLELLSQYDAVFDFAKYCLALPHYVFENEERLVDVTYETSLNELIKGPISRRKYASVPSKYKVFAKPVYYLESSNQKIFDSKELDDRSFHVEKSGKWKRIGYDEEGFDKKGQKIIGRTWVETNEAYYKTSKGVTKVNEIEVFDSENSGYIYVMREPSQVEGIFKIGLTTRSPETRRKELSNTSSPANFFVITSFNTKDCNEAEKQIHQELEPFRLSQRREFFKCDLKIILDTCQRVVDDINNSP